MTQSIFNLSVGSDNCTCYYPIGEKKEVNDFVLRNIKNPIICGTPSTTSSKGGRPRIVAPKTETIESRIANGWIYEDFLEQNREYALNNKDEIFLRELLSRKTTPLVLDDDKKDEIYVNRHNLDVLSVKEREHASCMTYALDKKRDVLSCDGIMYDIMYSDKVDQDIVDIHDDIEIEDILLLRRIIAEVKRNLKTELLELF